MQLKYTGKNAEITKRYANALFKAFLDFNATPTQMEQLLEVEPGTIGTDLHGFLCQFTADQIVEFLHASSLGARQELARQAYNLCMAASRARIDPSDWYQKLTLETQQQVQLTYRVKALKDLSKAAFEALGASIVKDEAGDSKQPRLLSIALHEQYVVAQAEYQQAFNQMWLGIVDM